MTVKEAYETKPHLLGSPKMVAIYETLTHVPWEDRLCPYYGCFSITSDGYVVSESDFLGSAEDFERNLKGLCEHFEEPQLYDDLMAEVTDWRPRGNAWGR